MGRHVVWGNQRPAGPAGLALDTSEGAEAPVAHVDKDFSLSLHLGRQEDGNKAPDNKVEDALGLPDLGLRLQ